MLMTRLLFVIIKITEADQCHNHINDIETSMKFTIEHDSNSSILFMDVCVTQKASGELITRIYKKPTHTIRCLNFNSAHSMSQKQGLVNVFKNSSITVKFQAGK